MHAAVHARLHAIEPGRADASLPAPVPEGLDAALWLLADFVSGLAVTGTLAAGERITTLRLTLHVLARDVDGTLHATGYLDERGPDVALSTAVITDDAGRTVARATGRNAILADDIAGDYRTAESSPWPPEPHPPHTLVRDGAAPDPVAVNTAEVVQGGVLASLPAAALAEVLGGPADEATATFLRAVPADGRTVHVATEVEHAGRRLRSGRAVLRDDRDKIVLSVSGLRYTPGA
ncbi:PaaI family thioesterase [Actinomycetospora flava]|uniref:Thioesterase superfamily protein n=1 Tax=Actinomycetospora flava TaxID=3129232 RepID=A0ABU8MEJ0_9PSEU